MIPGYRNVDTLCISQLIFNWTGWQEKAPYEAKAAQRKLDYEKVMKAYNKKQVNLLVILLVESNVSYFVAFFSLLTQSLTQESVVDDEDEESDKSNSVVNDEDDEETGEVISIGYGSMHCQLHSTSFKSCTCSCFLLIVKEFFSSS